MILQSSENLDLFHRSLVLGSDELKKAADHNTSSTCSKIDALQAKMTLVIDDQKKLIQKSSAHMDEASASAQRSSEEMYRKFTDLLTQLENLQRHLNTIKTNISKDVNENSKNGLEMSQNMLSATSLLGGISEKSNQLITFAQKEIVRITEKGNLDSILAQKQLKEFSKDSLIEKREVSESLVDVLSRLNSAATKAEDVSNSLQIYSNATAEGSPAHQTVTNAIEKLNAVSTKFEEIIEQSKLIDELNRKRPKAT
jgi:hypothetical protein